MALLWKKGFDFPVFVLANFAIDISVLVAGIWRPAEVFRDHMHSLLLGAAVGVLWGLVAHFLLDGLLRSMMLKMHLPYRTNLAKRIFSGIIGTWLHIFIDFLYKPDIQLFWPTDLVNPSMPLPRLAVSIIVLSAFFASLALFFIYFSMNKTRGKPW